MRPHIRNLAILNIVYGAMAAIVSMVVVAAIAMTLVSAGHAAFTRQNDTPPVLAIFSGMMGSAVATILVINVAPPIIAGLGLLRYARWARVLTIVVSSLQLSGIPFGTALGVYGLWVLLKPESEALFRGPGALPAQ